MKTYLPKVNVDERKWHVIDADGAVLGRLAAQVADVLRGKLLVQIHCYRADELLTEMAMAKEFGYKVRAFHHALEAYKVADKIAAEDVGIATFSDWWGYKQEAWDAIPWNAVMSMRNAESLGTRRTLSSPIPMAIAPFSTELCA